MSTVAKPAKIPARQKADNGSKTRGLPWTSSGYKNWQSSQVVRRKAWFLMTSVCSDLTDDNLEQLRHMLATCQAVKTEVKLSAQTLSWGKRGRGHRIKKTQWKLDEVQSIEQDEIFVNVMLCYFRLTNMPNQINYQIAAFKFHDTADVRALVWAFQSWTGAGPIEKSPSIINGTMLMKSTAGSVHSLAMPGRPTSNILAPERWVAVDRSMQRRSGSQSVGDLTAEAEYYSTAGGSRVVMRNGAANGVRPVSSGYRYRSSTTDERFQTMTSDEGNGSLSDEQQTKRNSRPGRNTLLSDASSSEPFSPEEFPTMRTNGTAMNASGRASVYTGDSLDSFGFARITTASGNERGGIYEMYDDDLYDDEYDDMSTISAMSSTFDVEPALTSRNNRSASAKSNGRVGNENRHNDVHRMHRSMNDVIDEEMPFENGRNNHAAIAAKSSNMRRAYARQSYGGSELGVATNGGDYDMGHRSRYNSREFQQRQGMQKIPVGRSRSAGPLQPRYARSDIGISYNNDDNVSIAASNMSMARQSVALVNPKFEKTYATRTQTAPGGSMYRQAARPLYVPSGGSAYGGVRNRAMSHRIR